MRTCKGQPFTMTYKLIKMDFVIASKFDFHQVHQITELQVQGEEGGGGVKKYQNIQTHEYYLVSISDR